jgi:hypothetical protein
VLSTCFYFFISVEYWWQYWGLANDEHTRIPLQDITCMMHNRVSDAFVPNASCFPLISFVVV